jgi:3D (Asp-Asp-Asp) domain-containing protein
MQIKKIAAGIAALGVFGFSTMAFYQINQQVLKLEAERQDDAKMISELNSQVDALAATNNQLISQNLSLQEQNTELQNSVNEINNRKKATPSRGSGHSFDVECTAYTLDGFTATGKSLEGLSHSDAMVIAVDPDIIPLGSTVRISFYDEEWSHLNGDYIASDTGTAIKGNIIDVFLGDGNDSEAFAFGRQMATAEIL